MNTPPSTHLAGKQMSSSLKARLKRMKSLRPSPMSTPHRQRVDKDSTVNASSPRKEVTVPIPLNLTEDGPQQQQSSESITYEIDDCKELESLLRWKKETQERITRKKEKLRKLKMVEMYRTKNNPEELTGLINKWREVSQEAIQDLRDGMPEPKPKISDLLNHLQLDGKLLNFDFEEESFS